MSPMGVVFGAVSCALTLLDRSSSCNRLAAVRIRTLRFGSASSMGEMVSAGTNDGDSGCDSGEKFKSTSGGLSELFVTL